MTTSVERAHQINSILAKPLDELTLADINTCIFNINIIGSGDSYRDAYDGDIKAVLMVRREFKTMKSNLFHRLFSGLGQRFTKALTWEHNEGDVTLNGSIFFTDPRFEEYAKEYSNERKYLHVKLRCSDILKYDTTREIVGLSSDTARRWRTIIYYNDDGDELFLNEHNMRWMPIRHVRGAFVLNASTAEVLAADNVRYQRFIVEHTVPDILVKHDDAARLAWLWSASEAVNRAIIRAGGHLAKRCYSKAEVESGGAWQEKGRASMVLPEYQQYYLTERLSVYFGPAMEFRADIRLIKYGHKNFGKLIESIGAPPIFAKRELLDKPVEV